MTATPAAHVTDRLIFLGRFSDSSFLAIFVIVPLVVRIWLAAAIPLTEDEAYYRLWALAPALSYLDHPPMVGWMIAAGQFIGGDTALGLRLPALAATALSTVALWRTAVLLTDPSTARIAVVFAVVIPLLSVGAIILTPDTPSVLFFLLGGWALAELHTSRNANWWVAVGAFAGLGLLSKYTNFFFGVAIVVWLLAVRRNWPWFRSWQLYAGGALALVLFTPVVIWNVAYDGASLAKQFGRIVDVEPFRITWTLEMWGALALLLGPVVFGLACKGMLQAVRRYMADGDAVAALLIALTLPLVIYFLAHSLHGRVLPNWLAPAYPMFAILAAQGAIGLSDARTRHRVVSSAIGISGGITTLIYAHALNPFYVNAKAKEPTHQLRGWAEFTAKVDAAAQQSGAAYVATTSYGTTGQLAFHLDRKWPVMQLDERLRYVHLPAPPRELFSRPGLVVELARRRPMEKLRTRYAKIETLGEITREFRGELLQSYAVFLVSQPVGDPIADDFAGFRGRDQENSRGPP